MPQFVWLSPFFLQYAEPCCTVLSTFTPRLAKKSWIVRLLLACVQALSSGRTQAVAHVRTLGNVTFCLCQGTGMSS